MTKFGFAVVSFSAAVGIAGAAPTVDGVSFSEQTDGTVEIAYTLADEAAVITFDVLSAGVPLPGEALRDVTPASDCWKVVQPGERTITWRPHAILPGGGAVTVRVAAWSVDNPPLVMVVDLQAGSAAAGRVRYYPSPEHLPGGLLENVAYRTSKLVFRKVMGVGGAMKMNQSASGGFDVTLSRNYYLGVFEFTQGQFGNFSAAFPNGCFSANRAMRPMESLAFNEVRCNAMGSTSCAGGVGPADAPYATSLLGLIRTRTGVAVDLPTEAEWEYACRAGWTQLHWGNGDVLSTADTYNSNMPGRHRYNGGYVGGTTSPASTVDVENGTAIVGSYAPNSWGFYDMHGNVFEYCIDWFESDITSYGGAVNVDSTDATKTLSGAAGTTRVRRGGSWHVGPGDSSPWNRLGCDPAARSAMWGFRLFVAAGTASAEGPAASGDSAAVALASVGDSAHSAAQALEARSLTWLESLPTGIKAVPPLGFLLYFR